MIIAPAKVHFALFTACLLAGCNSNSDAAEVASGAQDPLSCAAAISAYSYLVAEGFAASDDSMTSDPLVSSMTYLNVYAIPNGLSQEQAFAELEAKREELRANASTDQILDQARECVNNTPAS